MRSELSYTARLRQCATAVVCGALALATAGLAHAESTAGVAGVWRGPWYLGMTSGTAELVLPMDGRDGGTLAMTNNENFGDRPLPVTDIETDGGRLRFRVKGEDGKTLAADIPMDAGQPASLKGFARYGGFKLRFEFARVAVPK